jgi:predicted RecA/RadA family phage recombinase
MPASQNFLLAKGYPAAAAITKKRAVKFVGDGTQSVTPITAANDIPCGVALFSVSATEITKGKKASIMTDGRVVMESGVAAIAEGTVVYLDSVGRATNVATSATRIGICDEPASSVGGECSVSLD